MIHHGDVQTDKAKPSFRGKAEGVPASEEGEVRKPSVSTEPLGTMMSHVAFLPCFPGNFKGLCKQIDHFPEDADYEADTAEYFLRECMHAISYLLPGTGSCPPTFRAPRTKAI